MKILKWLIVVLLVSGGVWLVSSTYRQDLPSESVQESIITNSAELVIGETTSTVEINSNATVLEMMERAMSNAQVDYSGQEFEGLGFLVEEINGVSNDTSENKYWTLYINGEMAQLGASTQIVNNQDVIEWKYEKVEF